MKQTEEQYANELIDKYRKLAKMWDCYHDVPLEDKNDIQCAIIDVENTIEALRKILNKTIHPELIQGWINYYNGVLQILKDKL